MTYKNFYFLGIGGIGMSAIARYFNAKGFNVAGYDRKRSKLCEELEAEGIAIHYEDKVEAIANALKTNRIRWWFIRLPFRRNTANFNISSRMASQFRSVRKF